jgi:radical SAM protein with 4Fe4S-binding SPASM domain
MNDKIYCTAPWNALTIRENGNVKTCCPGFLNLGNLNEQSMQEIEQGNVLNEIKTEILDGKIPENCRVCRDLEADGINSMRHHYNNMYAEIHNELRFLDVRWNKLCNLTCIYCDDDWSTSWIRRMYPDAKVSAKTSYDEDLLNWILGKADQIEHLMLVGGEPLLMKQNLKLLANIKESVKIDLITNLSSNIEKNPITILLLEKFGKAVHWDISVENYGNQFEYVRNGGKWQLFNENLQFLVKKDANVLLGMVYAVFSGFTLLKTAQYYHSIGIYTLKLETIMKNPAMNIFNYPKPVLEIAYKEILEVIAWRKRVFCENYFPMIGEQAIVSNLERLIEEDNQSKITKQQFLEEIQRCDQLNKYKFEDLWRDQYDLILSVLK